MSEQLTIAVFISGLSEDGSRFRILHDIYKEDGRLAARHEVSGAWFDLRTRKLIAPPADLADIFSHLQRADNFESIALTSPTA